MYSELAERVFQPGNLIHGTHIRNLSFCLENGLRPRKTVEQNVCFALLSTRKLPDRYKVARHYGPQPRDDERQFGVVVSRERLLGKFPNKVKAVGEIFWSLYFAKHFRGGYIFDIPISIPYYGPAYSDEVKLMSIKSSEGVTSDLWEAYVVRRTNLPFFYRQARGLQLPRLPIFSPDCVLIKQTA